MDMPWSVAWCSRRGSGVTARSSARSAPTPSSQSGPASPRRPRERPGDQRNQFPALAVISAGPGGRPSPGPASPDQSLTHRKGDPVMGTAPSTGQPGTPAVPQLPSISVAALAVGLSDLLRAADGLGLPHYAA